MSKSTKPDRNGASAPPAAAKPVQVEVTEAQIARCRRSLLQKLARAIVNNPEEGDVGVISKCVADLRAIDLIEPLRAPVVEESAEPDSPDVVERKAAAENDAAMQAYNAKVARKESIDADRAEG